MTQHDTARHDRTMLRATRVCGAVLAFLIALVHLVEAPAYLEEEAYVGVLFIVGGLVMLGAAGAILGMTGSWARIGWSLGALVAAGMFVGGVLSRTTGLPGGFSETGWEVSLVVSLVLEVAYLVLWLWAWVLAPSRSPARR